VHDKTDEAGCPTAAGLPAKRCANTGARRLPLTNHRRGMRGGRQFNGDLMAL